MAEESPRTLDNELLPSIPEVHHVIGASQRLPLHLGSFLQLHASDPAVTVIIFRFKCVNAGLITQ